jgi:hypothetical protein
VKLVRLIKTGLNETYSEVHTDKNLIHFLHINGMKQGNVLLLSLFSFASEYAIRKVQADQDGRN